MNAVPAPLSQTPGLARRLACALYESLLLLAVLLIAALPVAALTLRLPHELMIALMRLYLLLVAGGYFALFWRRGQTLAMKTWRIRIESARGGPPSLGQVWARYCLACLNLLLLGIGWWAALLSRDRQFLHDRLVGTRLVRG